MLVRTVTCLEGEVEVELVCEPAFDYGRTPAEWTLVDGSRHVADATGAGQTIRLQTDLELGIEGTRVRARHTLRQASGRYFALSWADGLLTPADVDDATARLDATVRFWRDWLARARICRPPMARGDPALGAGDQGPDVHADRGDRRGVDHVAARDAGRRAQLGLPLHVDARLDVHAAGAALCSASTGRPTSSCSSSPISSPTSDGGLQIMYGIDGRRDLTESFREELSGYAGAQPGADRQRRLRSAPERRLRRGARLDPHAHDAQPAAAAAAVAAHRRPRPSAPRRSGASPIRASGRRAASPSTTSPRS